MYVQVSKYEATHHGSKWDVGDFASVLLSFRNGDAPSSPRSTGHAHVHGSHFFDCFPLVLPLLYTSLNSVIRVASFGVLFKWNNAIYIILCLVSLAYH